MVFSMAMSKFARKFISFRIIALFISKMPGLFFIRALGGAEKLFKKTKGTHALFNAYSPRTIYARDVDDKCRVASGLRTWCRTIQSKEQFRSRKQSCQI